MILLYYVSYFSGKLVLLLFINILHLLMSIESYYFYLELREKMFELIIVVLIIIDQISKKYVQSSIRLGESVPVINDFFHITYVENRGAAFGLLQDKQYIFIVIAILVVIGGIIYIHKSKEKKISKIAVAMILAGAVGNLIDRIYLGYVVDFFDFRFIWNYVFNFADVLVVVGTFILCVYLLITGKEQ